MIFFSIAVKDGLTRLDEHFDKISSSVLVHGNLYLTMAQIENSIIAGTILSNGRINPRFDKNNKTIFTSHIKTTLFFGVNFQNCMFDRVLFQNCVFVNCDFVNCGFGNVSFDRCYFIENSFLDTYMEYNTFEKCSGVVVVANENNTRRTAIFKRKLTMFAVNSGGSIKITKRNMPLRSVGTPNSILGGILSNYPNFDEEASETLIGWQKITDSWLREKRKQYKEFERETTNGGIVPYIPHNMSSIRAMPQSSRKAMNTRFALPFIIETIFPEV